MLKSFKIQHNIDNHTKQIEKFGLDGVTHHVCSPCIQTRETVSDSIK